MKFSDTVNPNLRVNTIKFRTITPESNPVNPAKSKSMPVRKNCFTTPSGIIQPMSSPNTEPMTAPQNRVTKMKPSVRLFNGICLVFEIFNFRFSDSIMYNPIHYIINDITHEKWK